MYQIARAQDAEKNLRRMVSAIGQSLTDAPGEIAALANVSAFVMAYMHALNWAGFYSLEPGGQSLVLGPFQGLPACTRIPMGSGVCGTAAAQGRTLRVDDVALFPGHIACDSASRSELVVPIFRAGALWGVLDLDSPEPGRFTALEAEYAEAVARLVGDYLAGAGAQGGGPR